MKINGTEMEAPRIEEMWRENKIYLEQAFLKDSVTNVVEFLIDNNFNNDQFGFVLSKDTDGQEYVFIQTVPYYASRILPMFDQPDLKGKFSIAVIHPENDVCITTGNQHSRIRYQDVTQHDNEKLTWFTLNAKGLRVEDETCVLSEFEATPYLSSYLLNLVCGPLVEIAAAPEQIYNNIPMKVFCRSSLEINL